ncbi:MAG TPA: tRNA 2-thiouridine(34) synthase MnmA [Candidatus Dormibacteraeota bacterium]
MTALAGAPAPVTRAWPAATVPDDWAALLPAGAVVAVAMSGGVDSSVAAASLAERGLRCLGITLAMWPRDRTLDRDRGCCSVDAVEDARRVCALLGIPHYAWNLEAGFRAAVVADFEAEYAAGRTPNPCVRCNQRVKFGLLLERALAAGATHLATGHYARVGRRDGRATLHRGVDVAKDQAYTLHRVAQPALARAVFPVAGLPTKAAVRDLAASFGLPTATKPESQELCFVDGPLRADLGRRLAGRFAPGPVVDAAGAVVGQHPGLPFLTVGQRSGLKIAPRRPDQPPLHVLHLDPQTNTAVVGPAQALLSRSVTACGCVWIERAPELGTHLSAQVRAHGEAVDCVVVRREADLVTVDLAEPVLAIAPGQSLVLFAGDEVAGGGIIAAGVG